VHRYLGIEFDNIYRVDVKLASAYNLASSFVKLSLLWVMLNKWPYFHGKKALHDDDTVQQPL